MSVILSRKPLLVQREREAAITLNLVFQSHVPIPATCPSSPPHHLTTLYRKGFAMSPVETT